MGGLPRRQLTALGSDERGQSVFDFSIGISLFLVVVVGVLLFVPTAFSGLGGGSVGNAGDNLAAERGAGYLSNAAFALADSSSGFETGCTLLFFAETVSHPDVTATPSECGFEQSAPLGRNLSLTESLAVNVTIERDVDGDGTRDVLCWSESDDSLQRVATCSPGGSPPDIPLSAGSSAADNDNTAEAERYAQFNGNGVYVVVRVW